MPALPAGAAAAATAAATATATAVTGGGRRGERSWMMEGGGRVEGARGKKERGGVKVEAQ